MQNPKLKYCVVSSCLHRQNDSHCHPGHVVFEVTEDCGEQGLGGIISAVNIVSLHN